MNRLRSLTAGAIVVALFAGGTALAQGGRAGGRGPMGNPGVMLRGLNLTETQQQQVRDIRQRYREESQQAAQRVREATQAQRKAVEAIPVNEGLIRSTTLALAEAQTEVAILQARVHGEIFSLLTEAQQEQVRKLQAERETRMEQRGSRQRSR